MGVSVTTRALAAVAAVAGMVLGSGPGHANLVLNGGFEDLYDNWYLDFATVAQCAALGCAPNGGDRAGALGGLPASGNRSFSQTVTLPGAGSKRLASASIDSEGIGVGVQVSFGR